jgi:hypothetical protein
MLAVSRVIELFQKLWEIFAIIFSLKRKWKVIHLDNDWFLNSQTSLPRIFYLFSQAK